MWVLWRGHMIEHQRMTPEESDVIIHDRQRVVRLSATVHMAKSRKDLMILKLSLGDYL
ncbi:hypothetical protein D3C71_1998870 [compost metagenome]